MTLSHCLSVSASVALWQRVCYDWQRFVAWPASSALWLYGSLAVRLLTWLPVHLLGCPFPT